MTIYEQICENIEEGVELLYPTGFENAVIGVDARTGNLILSVRKIIDQLMQDDEMEEIDAIEYYEYNMAGAYVGENGPIYCYDLYDL